MNQKLQQAIESFLADRRKSEGGFAPVEKGDMKKLYRVLDLLIDAKWQKDPDGDLPVNYKLIDRTRYEPMHFFTVPYEHKAKTDEEREDILDRHLTNLRMSADRVDNLLKIRRLGRSQKPTPGGTDHA